MTETISVVASIVSVIIACFAIWLSVTFYKMSTKISEATGEAAREISSGVNRLEKLFDRLYADTFSMMRDTVSDMRKHIWPETGVTEDVKQVAEQKADEKIEELRKEMSTELSNIVKKLGLTDVKVGKIRSYMESLLDKVIVQSRSVEKQALSETLRDDVLKALANFASKLDIVWAETIAIALMEKYHFSDIFKELVALSQENIIEFPDYIKEWVDIRPYTPIKLKKK